MIPFLVISQKRDPNVRTEYRVVKYFLCLKTSCSCSHPNFLKFLKEVYPQKYQTFVTKRYNVRLRRCERKDPGLFQCTVPEFFLEKVMRCHEKSLRIFSLCPKSVNRYSLRISRNANREATMLGCQHWLPTMFSLATLSVAISLPYRAFVPTCLPFWERLCSDIVRFGYSYKFSFPLGVLNMFWGFSGCASEVLLVLPGIRWFLCVGWLSSGNAMQPFYWVYCDLGAFLSLLVYKDNVCSCNATLLHVRVCMCMLLLKKWVFW